MMFRKLHWVTEQVDPLGTSRVAGVFTSIPDLIKNGLADPQNGVKLRITLARLDGDRTPFGTWCEPDFAGLSEILPNFVATEEFSPEQCQMLLEALRLRSSVTA